ncbi:HAD family phosphatase [Agriterribacter sp.]|uniref:HAD family hydrolase n=1 Tax=Agriterribacter sp. TaxID=2821509 RepID=UPI002BD7D79B|nr:HAD family phosphatase [Agriterribacter sp.]HRP55503.1 HAD family phosphatase [Agriterribacter sp.]
MVKAAEAFIFDLNGTMIDDMAFHVKAWYHLLNDELGAGLSEEQVKVQMYGKNSEVMDRIFGKGHFSVEEADRLSLEKEKRYQSAYLPHLKLIEGLDGFLETARQRHIPMAIGSAAIPFNIDFVLDNLHLRKYFSAIVSANDVKRSKPDPETYLKAADLLQTAPQDCLVFEDAPKGVEAALNAGMQAVVLTTMHHKDEFVQYPNVVLFTEKYSNALIQKLAKAQSF